jgi:hypothetical protein
VYEHDYRCRHYVACISICIVLSLFTALHCPHTIAQCTHDVRRLRICAVAHTNSYLPHVNATILVDVTPPLTQCLARCCCRNGQAIHPQLPLRNTTQLLTPATPPPNPHKCLPSLLSQCSRESLLLLHHDVAAGTVRSSIIFTFINLNPLHFHQRRRGG